MSLSYGQLLRHNKHYPVEHPTTGENRITSSNNNNNNNNNNSQLRLELTNRYPKYKVNQSNIIMDVLRGCSKEVEQNIKELVGDKCESIMRQIAKGNPL